MMEIEVDKYNPHIRLTQADLPGIKQYDVGDTYYALYKCKMTEKSISGSGKVSGEFEVLAIKPVPHPQVSNVKSLIKKKDASYD